MTTTNNILKSYSKQNGVIMRGITSKYSNLIEEVKYYISNGWVREEAIDFVLFNEFDFMFNNNESDRQLLNGWMLNKMH